MKGPTVGTGLVCSRNRVNTSVGEHGEQVGRLEDEDRGGQDLGHLRSCRLWKEAGFSFPCHKKALGGFKGGSHMT